MPGGNHGAHKLIPGVVQGGGAGIRDQGYISRLHHLEHPFEAHQLVVLMVAQAGGVYIIMLQQSGGMAGIFCCDQLHFPQCAQGACADIFQVPNWGCHQVEGAHGNAQVVKSRVRLKFTGFTASSSTLPRWASFVV